MEGLARDHMPHEEIRIPPVDVPHGDVPHGEGITGGGEASALIDLVEEYALLVVFGVAVLYFIYMQVKKGFESVSYELKSRRAENDVRRAREAQQARYWEDTAAKRAELARIAEERRKDKLEDMEAAAEGRTSKAKKEHKTKDNRDYWDGKDGVGFGKPGGGTKTFKPSGMRRRGG